MKQTQSLHIFYIRWSLLSKSALRVLSLLRDRQTSRKILCQDAVWGKVSSPLYLVLVTWLWVDFYLRIISPDLDHLHKDKHFCLKVFSSFASQTLKCNHVCSSQLDSVDAFIYLSNQHFFLHFGERSKLKHYHLLQELFVAWFNCTYWCCCFGFEHHQK